MQNQTKRVCALQLWQKWNAHFVRDLNDKLKFEMYEQSYWEDLSEN